MIRVSGCGAAGPWFARFVQNGTGAQTRATASRLRAGRYCAVEKQRVLLSQAARVRSLRAGLPARLLLQAALFPPALSPEARTSIRQALRAAAANTVHYERRRPEETTLYRLVQEHLETFLAEVEAEGAASLPQFVKDEFDARADGWARLARVLACELRELGRCEGQDSGENSGACVNLHAFAISYRLSAFEVAVKILVCADQQQYTGCGVVFVGQ